MKKILNGLFLACAFLAVALAFGYVAVEAAAVVIGNGALTVWAETYQIGRASCRERVLAMV